MVNVKMGGDNQSLSHFLKTEKVGIMKAIKFEFDMVSKETSITLRIPNWLPIIFGHYNETFIGREDDDKVWRWKGPKGKPVTDLTLLAQLDYARKCYWKECKLG